MTDPGADRSQLFRRGGHLFMVVAAIFTGLAGALGAVVFRLMIGSVQAGAWGGIEGLQEMFSAGVLAEPSVVYWSGPSSTSSHGRHAATGCPKS
jgi:hypothetical protein